MTPTEFLAPDFLKFFVPLVGAVVAWMLNERRRWRAEQHARKEERYTSFLQGLRGFYVDDPDGTLVDEDAKEIHRLKRQFLDELNISWLYCPDKVIDKAYAFLETVRVGATATAKEKAEAAGELVAAIRHDLLGHKLVKRTSLTGKDFRHLAVWRTRS